MHAAQKSSGDGYADIYVNENHIAYSSRRESSGYSGFVSLSVTIKLQRDDKVKAKFTNYLYNLNESKTTFFEGRLISKLESAQAKIPVYNRFG